MPQKPPNSKQQPSCPTHYAELTSNIPFTGWIEQKHLNAMSDSCPSKLDGEMLPSRPLWNLAEAIKHENFNFYVFMALLGHSSDECFLMARLGLLGSLKSKRKSN